MSIIPIRRPGERGPGVASSDEALPHSRPAPDWLELCRKEFIRRYYAENSDDYENSPNVYGE